MLLPRGKGRFKDRGAYFLAIPQGLNIWDIDRTLFPSLIHPRIPEDRKIEYLNRLADIIEKVPSLKALQEGLSEAPLETMKLRKQIDKLPLTRVAKSIVGLTPDVDNDKSLAADLGDTPCHIRICGNSSSYQGTPQINIPGNHSNSNVIDSDSIFTFCLRSPQVGFPLEQIVDVLGSSTLAELSISLYCVQDCLPWGTGFGGNFFYIEGAFYVDDPHGYLDELGEGQVDIDDNMEREEFYESMQAVLLTKAWLESADTDIRNDESDASSQTADLTASTQLQRGHGQTSTRDESSATGRTIGAVNSSSDVMSTRRQLFGVDQTVPVLRQQDTRLDSLRLRLGARYLYAHKGGRCEHFLYCSDVRLHNRNFDTQPRENFPLVKFQCTRKMRKCSICVAWSARYVVFGDRLADTSPCFFCQHCYHALHYSKDGRLLYDDFTVFPYLHDL